MQPDMIASAIHALQLLLEPARLMILFVGVLIGLAIGVLPGLNGIVGMAMLIEISQARGRTLAFNGVCGNLGAALAAGMTAALVAGLGWRAAFLVPGIICVATAILYLRYVPDEARKAASRGTVQINGRDVTEPHPDFGIVFQQANLMPWRRVLR